MLAYKSLCPSGWTTRWDDQRGKPIQFTCSALAMGDLLRTTRQLTCPIEAGNFPVNLNQ